MTKRIFVIPDVHGLTFWKEPVNRYIDQVDKVVFLGDYLDPYEYVREKDMLHNLMEIIELKLKHQDKVILLKGNHDQHYSSKRFRELAGGSRMSYENWDIYNLVFNEHKDLFQLAHLEMVKGIPYVFSHAGATAYWINKVNSLLWQLNDSDISLDDPNIIKRINLLDTTNEGQELLSVVGRERSRRGEKTGSILWADIREHSIPMAPDVYGLNKVFQVFGHTRMNGETKDKIEFDNLAMIDSQKCFVIDEKWDKKIVTMEEDVRGLM